MDVRWTAQEEKYYLFKKYGVVDIRCRSHLNSGTHNRRCGERQLTEFIQWNPQSGNINDVCRGAVLLRFLETVRGVELEVVERLDAALAEEFRALDFETQRVDRV